MLQSCLSGQNKPVDPDCASRRWSSRGVLMGKRVRASSVSRGRRIAIKTLMLPHDEGRGVIGPARARLRHLLHQRRIPRI